MSEHVERCGLQVADGLADFVADRILRTVLAKHSQFAMRRDRPLQINHGDLQALVCGRGWTMDAKKESVRSSVYR